MLRINNLVTPEGFFDIAIKGMRNAFKSWDKHDSGICYGQFEWPNNKSDLCIKCPYYKLEWVNPDDELDYEDTCNYYDEEGYPVYVLGENDLKLLLNLCKAGDPSHRKILRQLPVMFDITAPLYFFKQFDTYKVGTTANSTSTMHTMTKYPFRVEDFSISNFNDVDIFKIDFLNCEDEDNISFSPLRPILNELIQESGIDSHHFFKMYILVLNALRDKYLETKDMKYWYAINELLPQSYNQTRTWSGNYEVLLNMIQQRKNHPLVEWQTFSDLMLENVPYLKEIYEAINESNKKQ